MQTSYHYNTNSIKMISTSNIATEAANNKVLPGDKTGLPWEVWQLILSWLSAPDLCRVTCVCKTWAELVASVDSTRWKELYLGCRDWHHPLWPLSSSSEPPSWRLAYRNQYTTTRFWCHWKNRTTKNVTCTVLFKKNTFQRSIHIGPGLACESLKAALGAASDYDRIVVHPGIYDEQLEISSKVAFELVGYGELGSVILNVGIKQLATSTRFTNVVLRAPWFTSYILNINSGHVQIDNCILEDGIICCRSPSTLYIKFCSFRHASVILQNMHVSIIENCEFSQSGGANIFVEGHPKGEPSWACVFLKEHMETVYRQQGPLQGTTSSRKASSSTTSAVKSSFAVKSQTSASSWPLSDTVFQKTGFNFAKIERNPWTGEPNNDDSKVYNLTGFGVLQSVCGENVSFTQAVVDPVLSSLTSMSRNQSKHLQTSHEYADDKVQFSDKESMLDNNLNNARKPQGTDKCNVCEFAESIVQKSSKESLSKTSFKQACEQKCHHTVEKISSCNICNYKVDSLLAPDFSSCKTQFDSAKVISHASFRAADQWKSIDSHVDFNLSESLAHPPYVTGSRDKETPNMDNSFDTSVDTNHCKLSPVPKLSPTKMSDKEKQKLDSMESVTKSQNQGSLMKNKHLTQTEINVKNNAEAINMSTDKSLSLLSKERIINTRRSSLDEAKSFENKKTCSTEKDMSLTYHTSIDAQDTNKPEALSISDGNISQKPGNYQHKLIVQVSVDDSLSLSSVSYCNTKVETTYDKMNDSSKVFDSQPCFSKNEYSVLNLQNVNEEQLQGHDDKIKHLGSPHESHCSYQGNDVLQYQPESERPQLQRSQSDELSMESEEDISILDEIESSIVSSQTGSDIYNSSSQSTDSSDVDSICHLTDSDGEFSCREETVIMLPHLRELHVSKSNSCSPVGADTDAASVASEDMKPAPVNVLEDTVMRSYIEHIRGCLIHRCRMNLSKGGVMVSQEAHAVVSECDISDLGYGIRCIQNSRIVILNNHIHHCQTSGIFMRLAATGLIAGNDIHSNSEAGIDIRKNAHPLVQFNQIHHGKRSGVVVLGSGRGQIQRNDIYSNAEAGVYVLYGGNPVIRENCIFEGRAAGIAINAGGKGFIIDNLIRRNHWGGIDIRNGGSSLVSGNRIISGISHGIVLGLDGWASVENNFISGNAGCGVWMMAANNVTLRGNQICNNGQSGVFMLDKTAYLSSSVERHLGLLPADAAQRVMSPCTDGVQSLEPNSDIVQLQYNNICYNTEDGVRVEMKKKVQLQYNIIHGNHMDGLHLANCVPSVVEDNRVSSNGGSGIVTSLHDQCNLSGNGIYDNYQHGIVCRGLCVIDQNDIVGHPQHAVHVQARGHLQIAHSRLCSSNVSAVKGEEQCSVTATNNKIYDTGGGDFNCQGKLISTENVLRISGKNGFSKTDFLRDPPPRPHIPPPPHISTAVPFCNVTPVTKVMETSTNSCEEGSKLCGIL